MRHSQLPITVLREWAKLNDVVFYDIIVKDFGSKGFGFSAERALTSNSSNLDMHTLLHVPQDMVLSAEAVKEHAKTDNDFRSADAESWSQLLDVAGGNVRRDTMLFLLLQMTINSPDCPHAIGVSGPWTAYVKMLPSVVPLPTTWTDQERTMLIGTSLESAVSAKLSALLREFETLRDRTSGLSWCRKVWWENESLSLNDWILIDSWYRSRSLELPIIGDSLVPCLDMSNHAPNPNAYYERTASGDVVLLLMVEQKLQRGDEVTISYDAAKSAAEMIFSYGFFDETYSKKSLVLNLQPSRDDPLGKAKLAAFNGAPIINISSEDDIVTWSSPFLCFMILNEEDGLDFKVSQQTDGSLGELQVFWQGQDVTKSTDVFEHHILGHPMYEVFRLRAVALLQDRLGDQIELLYASDEEAAGLQSDSLDPVNKMLWEVASRFRAFETKILQAAYEELESQKAILVASPSVVAYLESMGGIGDPPQKEKILNGEDYS